MKVKATFKGIKKFRKQLAAYPQSAINALKGALYTEADTIMTASKKLVPVDTGALRSTGHTQKPDVVGNTVTVTLGYGGVAGAKSKGKKGKLASRDVGYAVIVHEDTQMFHKVGQAKYLEVPLNNARAGFSARVARRFKSKRGQIFKGK